jgi:hypothetical protein
MTKGKAIQTYCRECSGDSAKEVTLCHIFDCPLWPYRCGCHVSTAGYKKRMSRALENYPEEVKELQGQGIDIGFFTDKQ